MKSEELVWHFWKTRLIMLRHGLDEVDMQLIKKAWKDLEFVDIICKNWYTVEVDNISEI